MPIFAALADPIRARIVELLAERDLTAGEIAARFPVSRPAVSRHLRVLRREHLVDSKGVAQRRIYTLNPDAFSELEQWVQACRRTWNKRFDALGRHLDNLARKTREKRK